MTRGGPEIPILRETAGRLRAEIQKSSQLVWPTRIATTCWLSSKLAEAAPSRVPFHRTVHNRGCGQVNRRYDEELRGVRQDLLSGRVLWHSS